MAKKKISAAGFFSVHFTPVASDDTNIAELGLTREGAALLTPKAKKLTKADLIALYEDEATEREKLDLSVADVNSIKKAFATRLSVTARVAKQNGGGGVSVGCCTCPCCCAAAVIVEQAIQ